jgi:Rho GTPase-activating protein 1
MATAAASILYLSPLPSPSGHPIYILNSAALPDTSEVEYDTLLPYVLARLPGEEDLISGAEYEVVVFAGGNADSATSGKKGHPGVGWFIQAYHVLTRAMRKRIQKLYIVHERRWVRVLVEVFGTIASPKFKRKIVHAGSLTQLARHIDITSLLIPPSAYLRDRDLSSTVHVEGASGRRAFSARPPLPKGLDGVSRLPRVLRETTSFILLNLGTEGLFRIPAHIKQKEILREAYDRGQKFIIWKERGVYLPQIQQSNTLPQVDMDAIAKEIDPVEAYGVHLAAGLCKFWYSELREPLFPSTSYKDLRKLYGNTEESITLEKLTELLSPVSEWSILPATSREIMIRHLLPLLATIATKSEENKMTPDNLAVCFSPTLCCGEDPIEDAKSSSVIRRVLAAAIEQWHNGLREACGTDESIFQQDLQAPAHMEDYEDPLPVSSYSEKDKKYPQYEDNVSRPGSKDGFTEEQQTGILLRDNDISTTTAEKSDGMPPPLPPRQQLSNLNISSAPTSAYPTDSAQILPPLPPRSPQPPSATSDTTPLRRHVLPPHVAELNTALPPRYSQVVASDEVGGMTESPSAYVTPANGFGPARRGDWSFDVQDGEIEKEMSGVGPERKDSQVRRKPVGTTPTSPTFEGGLEEKVEKS